MGDSDLFARPSFLEGMARALDIGNTLQEYNTSPSPEAADGQAIGSDWAAVGNDLQKAINTEGGHVQKQEAASR